MSKKEIVKWKKMRFIAYEFDHYTKGGAGICSVFVLAFDSVFHKFSCGNYDFPQLFNHEIKPFDLVNIAFRWHGERKILSEIEKLPTEKQ